MELNEIEHQAACGELSAAQVFTQMKQHLDNNKATEIETPTKGFLYAFTNSENDSIVSFEEFDRVMINKKYLTESGNQYAYWRRIRTSEWAELGAPIK